jgi:hypothetical protein
MEVVKMLFGSTLYGTRTADSDMDYKGIVLPTWRDMALCRVPKQFMNTSTGNNETKNTSADEDIEIFYLHEWVKLAMEGQTAQLDMLFCPEDCLLASGAIWDAIVAQREKLISKNVESFLGYCQKQASKYGIKGSRLNAAKTVLDWFDAMLEKHGNIKLIDCDLSTFPVDEHVLWHTKTCEFNEVTLSELPNTMVPYATDMIEVCNRKIGLTVKLQYAKDMVQHFYDEYGERAKKAASDEGIDWKAISHAFRAAYQIQELFTEGRITFPRPEAKFLVEIKTGMHSYAKLAPVLEAEIEHAKYLRDKSSLPENVDVKYWEQFVIDVAREYIIPYKTY